MTAPALQARGVRLAYDGRVVVDNLNLQITEGEMTVMLGANGCGKSTVLRALGGLLKPERGGIFLHDRPIAGMRRREIASRLAILPQTSIAPAGTTVFDLVMRGRNPHRSWARPWTPDDAAIAMAAISATGLSAISDRDVSTLSGGQRQRAWIALVVAQQAPTVMLDEPTTFLDLTHQLQVLRLLRNMNRNNATTIVMVLHDVSLAARYADRLVVLSPTGDLIADGTPHDVVTPEVLWNAFALHAQVIDDPISHTPLVIPREPHAP